MTLLEELKKKNDYIPTTKRERDLSNYGWNQCLDFLARKGYLKQANQLCHIETAHEMLKALDDLVQCYNGNKVFTDEHWQNAHDAIVKAKGVK